LSKICQKATTTKTKQPVLGEQTFLLFQNKDILQNFVFENNNILTKSASKRIVDVFKVLT
jgi:hypothetical protein